MFPLEQLFVNCLVVLSILKKHNLYCLLLQHLKWHSWFPPPTHTHTHTTFIGLFLCLFFPFPIPYINLFRYLYYYYYYCYYFIFYELNWWVFGEWGFGLGGTILRQRVYVWQWCCPSASHSIPDTFLPILDPNVWTMTFIPIPPHPASYK